MGPEIYHNPYHVLIVRSQLNQNLNALYPVIRSEITTAFDDVLELRADGEHLVFIPKLYSWVSHAKGSLQSCDPDWIDLNIWYTIDIVKESAILALFPKVLKPIAARLFTGIRQSTQGGRRLLGSIIEE
ncbi:hypothetical protein OG21DRAFT_1527087 [Imleria badia]|nr:hypothetical protein OG21DRAFT_1527087 [Imleria badia]